MPDYFLVASVFPETAVIHHDEINWEDKFSHQTPHTRPPNISVFQPRDSPGLEIETYFHILHSQLNDMHHTIVPPQYHGNKLNGKVFTCVKLNYLEIKADCFAFVLSEFLQEV